jgi:hypothetical protein
MSWDKTCITFLRNDGTIDDTIDDTISYFWDGNLEEIPNCRQLLLTLLIVIPSCKSGVQLILAPMDPELL